MFSCRQRVHLACWALTKRGAARLPWCLSSLLPRLNQANDLFAQLNRDVARTPQIRLMAQSRLRLNGEARSPEDVDFMQFGALKMVYMEQVRSKARARVFVLVFVRAGARFRIRISS